MLTYCQWSGEVWHFHPDGLYCNHCYLSYFCGLCQAHFYGSAHFGYTCGLPVMASYGSTHQIKQWEGDYILRNVVTPRFSRRIFIIFLCILVTINILWVTFFHIFKLWNIDGEWVSLNDISMMTFSFVIFNLWRTNWLMEVWKLPNEMMVGRIFRSSSIQLFFCNT